VAKSLIDIQGFNNRPNNMTMLPIINPAWLDILE
jgi:hypothetical protein